MTKDLIVLSSEDGDAYWCEGVFADPDAFVAAIKAMIGSDHGWDDADDWIFPERVRHHWALVVEADDGWYYRCRTEGGEPVTEGTPGAIRLTVICEV